MAWVTSDPRVTPDSATSDVVSLDVSGYARLWRVLWWLQRLGFLPAFVPLAGLLFLGFLFWAGLLDHRWEQWSAEVARTATSEETRRSQTLMMAAILRLLQEMFTHGGWWIALLIAAFGAIVGAFLFGCGTFRLRLATVGVAALAVVTAICFIGMINVAALIPESPQARDAVDAFESNYQLIYLAATLIFFVASFLLLLAQMVPLVWLWRHRLKREYPRTHRMTRSLGINLGVPKFTWRRLSVAGVAVQLAIVMVLGLLGWSFRRWILVAVIFGAIDVLYLLIYPPVVGISMIVRAVQGLPLLIGSERETILSSVEEPPKLILIAAVLVAARVIWRIGTRFHRKRRDEIVLKDKPPVLLLRSFVDDVAGIPANALLPRLFFRRKRLEEMIGEELAHSGPFVAIGKPGESLPQLGAERLYLGDSEWQDVVKSYISRAERIIMIAGTTHWVQWELAHTIELNSLGKLIIVFPRISDADRGARWENLRRAFHGTPWENAAAGVKTNRTLTVCVDGAGRFVPISSGRAYESDYEAALRIATYLIQQPKSSRAGGVKPIAPSPSTGPVATTIGTAG